MPLSRQQKEQLVDSYKGGLAAAPHVFLIDYKGVTVTQDTELRRRIRQVGGCYGVVKNRLALRAVGGQALAELESHFQGPTAVAFCEADPVGLAKAVTDFSTEVPTLAVKAALVEGRPVAAEEVRELARLPSREDLVTKLLFLLQSPISSLVTTLAALPRQFVVVLDQLRLQKETDGPDG